MKPNISNNKTNKLVNEALNLQNAGKHTQALKIYDKLLKHSPNNSRLLFLLGSLYGQMGNFDKCITSLRKSIQINPNQVDANNFLAFAYEYSGKLEAALKSYNNTLQINPENETALLNKANILAKLNRNNEARMNYEQALNLYPNNPVLLNNFSAFLQLQEDYAAAEELVKRAITINPNYPQALSNLGNILIKQEKFSDAENYLLKAKALNPNLPEIYINLGFLYHNVAAFEKALENFDKAIELDPKNSTGHWYRTFTLLIIGKFDKAWEDYEYRFIHGDSKPSEYNYPKFDPTITDDKPVLITAEQAIGDQIMFASCLPDILSIQKHIVLECDKRLVPVFKRSFPTISVIQTGQFNKESIKTAFPDLSQQIPIGSLPRIFCRSLNSFPKNSPYLRANEENILKWKKRYQQLGNKPKVGISWQGGIKIEHNKRSMKLESWEQILKCECEFINLQYGQHVNEITAVSKMFNIHIHDWDDSNSLAEIDDFSAQVAALDLIISVGNTNVHLAGSLNIPTWCIIPQVPSWRWLSNGDSCLWYPSVKMYRQQMLHEWEPVLNNIAYDLKLFSLEYLNNE